MVDGSGLVVLCLTWTTSLLQHDCTSCFKGVHGMLVNLNDWPYL